MQVVGKRSRCIYTLLFTLQQLLGRLSASTSSPPLPAPKLDIYSRSMDSVVLVCQSSAGHSGVQFMLYRDRKMVELINTEGTQEVFFNVKVKEGEEPELFCCLYKSQQGHYSAFSTYLQMVHQTDITPTQSKPSFPLPILSVEPSGGMVKPGDMLSFRCSVPGPLAQSNNQPVSFLLLKTVPVTEPTSVTLQPQAIQVSNPELQPGIFTVGPVRGGEDGEYVCLYQIAKEKRLVNSTISNVVQVIIKDVLPVPTLVLQQHTVVWHLLCTGSPAYPGAVFSLYKDADKLPVATYHAKLINHEATFPVPVQDTPVALYYCQYSLLLGGKWSNSEHSPLLAVPRGVPTPSMPESSSVDWPLVLGSFSASVLFLCIVAVVVVVACKKVKSAAKEKKKRQQEQFWGQVHAKDHAVDITLRCSSFNSQEWARRDPTTEMASRSPLLNSLSTFTSPVH